MMFVYVKAVLLFAILLLLGYGFFYYGLWFLIDFVSFCWAWLRWQLWYKDQPGYEKMPVDYFND